MSMRLLYGRMKKHTALTVTFVLVLSVLTLWLGTGCADLPVAEPQPGVVTRWDFPSSVDGLKVPCSIYLPSNYDSTKTYPMWVELHALYATPVLDNDPNDPISNSFKNMADEKGLIIVAPWGRNLHSMYIDGLKSSEPSIFDDFNSSIGSWSPVSGTWTSYLGSYRQSNTSLTWKESVRSGSTGENYSVRCRVRDYSDPTTETAIGVNLRRQSTGDCYHVDLYRDSTGAKFVRFFKYTGGTWELMYKCSYNWQPLNPLDGWIDLKFSCYQDYLEVYVNEQLINMQPAYDSTPYGYGRKVPGTALPAGDVSLCSYGGIHEFDDVRIQNEYEYGEQDVLDCMSSAMEKYRIDPNRVYLAGHSQGGLGAYTTALHNPDLFAATRPADGFTDLAYDYSWLKTHYPANPGISGFASINDGQLSDYMTALSGGEPDSSHPERASIWNENSARYILENAVNTNFRIVHGTTDADVPNTYDPVGIGWWVPFGPFWLQLGAPSPYGPGVATYRNGKDIADLLVSWASGDKYPSTYITNAYMGHGFLEPYADTADYFLTKTLNRHPLEVAYKTYDNTNNGAWWLHLEIPSPNTNQPGMARVIADPTTNSAALHARNLKKMYLDVSRMGLDNGAGKTLTFKADNNTAPNVFDITDTTGALALELDGAWPAQSGYTVALDGTTLQQGTGYTVTPGSITVNSMTMSGSHTLTVTVPGSVPTNLLSNPGAETADSNSGAANWSSTVSAGSSATFSWDDQEQHTGNRSLRVKDAQLSGTTGSALWTSDQVSVTAGDTYNLVASAKSRMLRSNYLGVGIAWYEADGTLLSTTWSPTAITSGNAAATRDWTQLKATGQAPAGSSYARIVAGAGGGSPSGPNGSAWFDDFCLSR